MLHLGLPVTQWLAAKVNFTLQQVINACQGSNIVGRRPDCKTLCDKLEI